MDCIQAGKASVGQLYDMETICEPGQTHARYTCILLWAETGAFQTGESLRKAAQASAMRCETSKSGLPSEARMVPRYGAE
eukprot:11360485-Alexandrium_andersonii.AAC.1